MRVCLPPGKQRKMMSSIGPAARRPGLTQQRWLMADEWGQGSAGSLIRLLCSALLYGRQRFFIDDEDTKTRRRHKQELTAFVKPSWLRGETCKTSACRWQSKMCEMPAWQSGCGHRTLRSPACIRGKPVSCDPRQKSLGIPPKTIDSRGEKGSAADAREYTRITRIGLIHCGSLMARRLRWLCHSVHDLVAVPDRSLHALHLIFLGDKFSNRPRHQTDQASMR